MSIQRFKWRVGVTSLTPTNKAGHSLREKVFPDTRPSSISPRSNLTQLADINYLFMRLGV